MAENGLVVNVVQVLIGAAFGAWFAYWCGRVHGAGREAELASRNIVAALDAQARAQARTDGGRVQFTGYPDPQPVFIAPELVREVIPVEHDATAILLVGGLTVAVAERVCDVVAALGVRA